MSDVFERIRTREAKVAVIGLGYVGLPLATEIAQEGFSTIGIDISEEKVHSINEGKNYISDISDTTLAELVNEGRLRATNDFSCLTSCDFVSICVPTPLGKGKIPDISFIVSAVEEVRKYLRPGHTIILESTTYPGTTEEVVLPLLEESGMKVGTDFYLAFSPERIDPGNENFTLKNTPKVIGGVTPRCTEVAQSLYQTFIDTVIQVSSTRAAEMVKILENTFRAINIGLANETALICHRMGIDVWEVIEAAASKPFGFMPFYPGPGLGGHCIPVDPHYLAWKLKTMNYSPRFIQLADEINTGMAGVVIDRVTEGLNLFQKAINGSSILVLGVAYKKDVSDVRESPALDIIESLKEKGANVEYSDPYVPNLRFHDYSMKSISPENLGSYDCIVIVTDHTAFDSELIVSEAQLIVDTRGLTKKAGRTSKHVIYL